jgi:RNA polymerase sigma-70 factor (ECF subfamily)
MTGRPRSDQGAPDPAFKGAESPPRPEHRRERAPEVADAALVARAQAGDEKAFALLVDRYGPMVLSLAYSSTLSRMDAEDLAQETFLVAWRGLSRFRGDAAFSTWLYGLARSRCADRARRAGARPRLAVRADTETIQVASGDPARRKTALAILAAAGRLPMPQRQAVLMRDMQGLSYDEIATLQDVPVGTVRSRIAGARRWIADEVGEV